MVAVLVIFTKVSEDGQGSSGLPVRPDQRRKCRDYLRKFRGGLKDDKFGLVGLHHSKFTDMNTSLHPLAYHCLVQALAHIPWRSSMPLKFVI